MSLFNQATNSCLRPLWSVNQNQHNGISSYATQGWKDCPVGKAHLDLFPLDIHMCSAGLQEPTCNVFQSGMMTVNFHNCYHKDKRDNNQVSHCSFSPPVHWKVNEGKGSSRKCAFAMGSVVCDISMHPMRISFLPQQVYHCTSEPFDVPMVPDYILRKCCSKTIFGNRESIYSFLSKSIMAWGSWAWWRRNTARQHEWQAAIDGVTERSAQIAARRALINRWSQHGYNPQVQQHRRKRAQRQAKRARKAYQTNKTK